MKAWLAERDGQPAGPLFPGPSGQRLSRDAVERRVKLYYGRASAGCPPLAAKHVTVHTLRHSAAMKLLLAGADVTVIALWLGHESLSSTQAYLHEVSGIASGGRETAGQQVKELPEQRSAGLDASPVTWEDPGAIPSTA